MGMRPRTNVCPKTIHPSPLEGGRLGGGWEATSERQPPSNTRSLPPSPLHLSPTPRSPTHHSSYHPLSCPLPSSFLRRQEPSACDSCAHHRRRPPPLLRPLRHSCAPSVIPAQAGTHPPQRPLSPPIHPSPLPGGRLGGGWEATSERQPPSNTRSPPAVIPAPLSSTPIAHPSFLASPIIPAPSLRHSCAGRNPARATAALTTADALRHSCAPFVIPVQAGTQRVRRLRSPPQTPSGTPAQWLVAGRGLGGRLVPACAGMTDGAQECTEGAPEVCGSVDALWRSGGGRSTRSLVDARCLSPPT